MQDKDLVPIEINFNKMRKMDEALGLFLQTWVKRILAMLLGDSFAVPVKITGTPAEVRSFVGAMKREKSYVEAYRNFGLNDPKTFKSRSNLKNAVSNFERTTGVKWPFDH